MCAAPEDDRKSAADRASSDARYRIGSALERTKRDALEALERVERDDSLRDKRGEASRLASDIKSRWDKLADATRGLRDGRHPVVDDMISRGDDTSPRWRERC